MSAAYNAAAMPPADPPVPSKRMSFDLPAPLHTRFKVACAQLGIKMKDEIIAAVRQRIAELEKKAAAPPDERQQP